MDKDTVAKDLDECETSETSSTIPGMESGNSTSTKSEVDDANMDIVVPAAALTSSSTSWQDNY